MIYFDLANLRTDQIPPLHHQLPAHDTPQLAFVQLSETNVLTAGYCPDMGCAVPDRVVSKLDLRWPVRTDLRGPGLADLLEGDALPLLNRIVAGRAFLVGANGRHGILDSDADRACFLMQAFLDNLGHDCDALWDVHDWLATGNGKMAHWEDSTHQDSSHSRH